MIMPAIACPLCSHAPTQPMPAHPEAALYRCPGCGHAFSDPASIVQRETYEADYYEREHRQWFEHPDVAFFRFLGQEIASHRPQGRVLDVGCGRGAFLTYLLRAHPQLHLEGIDLSRQPAEHPFPVHQGSLFDLRDEAGFDAITSSMVIEHVPDPALFLTRSRDLLRPGGRIYCHTIADDSVLYGSARGLRHLGICAPYDRLYSRHHLHHFSRRSLAALAVRCGLRIVAVHNRNMPLSAVDMGSVSPTKRMVFLAGVRLAFVAGSITGRTYAQTLVAERITQP
jgi:SAM-dependent methyltransferase